jgi:hypothetical protein
MASHSVDNGASQAAITTLIIICSTVIVVCFFCSIYYGTSYLEKHIEVSEYVEQLAHCLYCDVCFGCVWVP